MPFDLFHRGSSYTLIRQDGLTVRLPQAVRTKRYVLLFIAGQWWAPCRGVAAQLKTFYQKFHDTHDFEVIFLSTDKSERAMLNFFHDAHGDWLCLSYKDACNLQAALAGEDDLHPKQVPACLVFELDEVAFNNSSSSPEDGKQDAVSGLHSTPVHTLAFSSATPQSFARLITKHGREMLSRDKEGALFPWYDDGWNDAAAHRRSAALRNSPSAHTPITSPSAVPVDSVTKTKHINLGLYTDPHSPPRRPSSSSVATLPILKHQAAIPFEAESDDGAQAKENSNEEVVNAVEKADTITEMTDAALPAAQQSDVFFDVNHAGTTAAGRPPFTHSQRLGSHDKARAKSSPSPTITRAHDFAATTHAAQVDQEREDEEKQKGSRSADVGLHEVPGTHVSAAIAEVVSDETSAESGESENKKDTDAAAPSPPEGTKELSVAAKEVSAMKSPAQSEEKYYGDDKAQDVKTDEETQTRNSTGWRTLIGL